MRKNHNKARNPVQDRGIETRKKILDAARELFSEKGFHGTNSKEIAARAGIAVGTFYSYFDEKKPLFLEVFTRYYAEVREASFSTLGEQISGNPDIKGIVRSMIHVLYHAHDTAPLFHREAIAMMYLDPDVEKINREEEKKVTALLAFYLSQHKDKIRVDDIDSAAYIIHKTVEETIHAIKIFHVAPDEKRIISELEDMICRYLFP